MLAMTIHNIGVATPIRNVVSKAMRGSGHELQGSRGHGHHIAALVVRRKSKLCILHFTCISIACGAKGTHALLLPSLHAFLERDRLVRKI